MVFSFTIFMTSYKLIISRKNYSSLQQIEHKLQKVNLPALTAEMSKHPVNEINKHNFAIVVSGIWISSDVNCLLVRCLYRGNVELIMQMNL